MRVSVTAIDSLRYLLSTDKTLDEIIDDIQGEVEPTPAMQAGRAFHDILEYPPDEPLEVIERNGHRFEFALDADVTLPAVREIKAEYPIRVLGVDVTLVGKVDCMHGTRIDDHKLTRQFNAEKYASSFQWRAYLYMFGGTSFRYNVFTASQIKDGTWRVRAFDPLTFYTYPDIERDVCNGLSEFVAFCRDFIPSRFDRTTTPTRVAAEA